MHNKYQKFETVLQKLCKCHTVEYVTIRVEKLPMPPLPPRMKFYDALNDIVFDQLFEQLRWRLPSFDNQEHRFHILCYQKWTHHQAHVISGAGISDLTRQLENYLCELQLTACEIEIL